MEKPASVDAYIAGFPEQTQALLEDLRAIIREAAPDAEEIISNAMPAYRQDGPLVYFAGYKRHIGFYPAGAAINAFPEAVGAYKHAKGSIQFPLAQPMPVKLITDIVKLRVAENTAKAKEKAVAKKKGHEVSRHPALSADNKTPQVSGCLQGPSYGDLP